MADEVGPASHGSLLLVIGIGGQAQAPGLWVVDGGGWLLG